MKYTIYKAFMAFLTIFGCYSLSGMHSIVEIDNQSKTAFRMLVIPRYAHYQEQLTFDMALEATNQGMKIFVAPETSATFSKEIVLDPSEEQDQIIAYLGHEFEVVTQKEFADVLKVKKGQNKITITPDREFECTAISRKECKSNKETKHGNAQKSKNQKLKQKFLTRICNTLNFPVSITLISYEADGMPESTACVKTFYVPCQETLDLENRFLLNSSDKKIHLLVFIGDKTYELRSDYFEGFGQLNKIVIHSKGLRWAKDISLRTSPFEKGGDLEKE